MRCRMSGARLETEDLVLEGERTGVLAVERGDLDVHYLLSSAAAAAGLNEPGDDDALVSGLLDRVADLDPAALGARNRTLDHDQAARDIGPDDLAGSAW